MNDLSTRIGTAAVTLAAWCECLSTRGVSAGSGRRT